MNQEDPQSVAVASYYRRLRGIPTANVIRVRLKPNQEALDVPAFQRLKSQIDAVLGPEIQAIALSFTRPFRVGCMSLTSALTLGYGDFCAQKPSQTGCRPPQITPYYGSESVKPFQEFGLRPAMMLAGETVEQVQQLIERGVAAEASFPQGVGYLVTTQDRARNVRVGTFTLLAQTWKPESGWRLRHLQAGAKGPEVIQQRRGVLFYFTGLATVPRIETNQYLPGAVADHLTSYGGVLVGSSQMSVLQWLQAGVTASYGTVVEPCNLPAKFPDPEILVRHYYRGATVLEAYWKSVASPQEGVFVGEPLTRPMGVRKIIRNNQLRLQLSILEPGRSYQIEGAAQPQGPFVPVSETFQVANYQVVELRLGCDYPYYRLVRQALLPGK